MDAIRRRRLVAAIAGLTVAVTAAAACTHRWPPKPPGTTTTTASLPPGTVPDTAPGTIDCGTIDYASGWPTTLAVNLDAGPGKCFEDAYNAGTLAHLVTREQTDGAGGHPVVTTFDLVGRYDIRVVTDPTGSSDPSPVLVQSCSNLWRGYPPGQHLIAGNCWPEPPAVAAATGTNCGVYSPYSGWPTTMPPNPNVNPTRCILDAWAAGTPARYVVRMATDTQAGHIVITYYDVLGAGRVRVTEDARQALPPGGTSTVVCSTLTASGRDLHAENCTPG
jgi:hypothetical protein